MSLLLFFVSILFCNFTIGAIASLLVACTSIFLNTEYKDKKLSSQYVLLGLLIVILSQIQYLFNFFIGNNKPLTIVFLLYGIAITILMYKDFEKEFGKKK